jgi:hypothetical protein
LSETSASFDIAGETIIARAKTAMIIHIHLLYFVLTLIYPFVTLKKRKALEGLLKIF